MYVFVLCNPICITNEHRRRSEQHHPKPRTQHLREANWSQLSSLKRKSLNRKERKSQRIRTSIPLKIRKQELRVNQKMLKAN